MSRAASPGSRSKAASIWLLSAGSADPAGSLLAGSLLASCRASSPRGVAPGVNRANLRRDQSGSAGISPARSNDDFPEPEGPTTVSGTPGAEAPVASRTRRAVMASRPKNQGASSGWKLARPRYGAVATAGRRPGPRRIRLRALTHSLSWAGSVSPQARRILASKPGWLGGGRWRPAK